MSDDEIRIRPKYGDADSAEPKRISALDALVYQKWAEFAYRLITRQGTVPIDFDALRARQVELESHVRP